MIKIKNYNVFKLVSIDKKMRHVNKNNGVCVRKIQFLTIHSGICQIH